MKSLFKPYLKISLIVISILILILILSSLFTTNKEDNLYNIGNIEQVNESVSLDSVLVFDEFVFENFKDIELEIDQDRLYRADSIIEGTTLAEAQNYAEILLNELDNTEVNENNIDPEQFLNIKKSIRSNNFNDLDVNHFKSINSDNQVIGKAKTYLSDYVEFKAIKTDSSGYLLNYYDGYENLLSDQSTIDWSILRNPNDTDKISGLKFVDNNSYYLFSLINSITSLDKNKLSDTHITINDEEYRASFEDLIFTNNGYVLKFKLFEGLEKLVNERFVKANINLLEEDTFIVPKTSIMEKNGVMGLLFLDNGVITFTPVKIIKEESEYFYITNNLEQIFPSAVFNEEIEFDRLSPFDKILIDPTGYEEGKVY